jgi:hypothetical protein
MSLDPKFPLEFVVAGTPVSTQTKSRRARREWRERIRGATETSLPEGHFASDGRISVTIYYFPAGAMQGDIDNIVKPVLDALGHCVYLDDSQVERVVVQKFEPDNVFDFLLPTAVLAAALSGTRPVLYVGVSDDPFEDLT